METTEKVALKGGGILTKLSMVLRDMPDIEKSSIKYRTKRGMAEYEAFTIDPILSEVRPLFGRHGLAMNCDEEGLTVVSTGQKDETVVKFVFTLYDSESGEKLETVINQPVPSMSSVASSFNAADTFAVKRYLRRICLISDPSEEDPEHAIAGDSRDYRGLDGRIVEVSRIIKNPQPKSGKSPRWIAFIKAGGRIALWEKQLNMIGDMLGYKSGMLQPILDNQDIKFTGVLRVKVAANQYGLSLANEGHPRGLDNPAILYMFNRWVNDRGDEVSVLEALGVSNLSEFSGTIWDAMEKVESA